MPSSAGRSNELAKLQFWKKQSSILLGIACRIILFSLQIIKPARRRSSRLIEVYIQGVECRGLGSLDSVRNETSHSRIRGLHALANRIIPPISLHGYQNFAHFELSCGHFNSSSRTPSGTTRSVGWEVEAVVSGPRWHVAHRIRDSTFGVKLRIVTDLLSPLSNELSDRRQGPLSLDKAPRRTSP